MVTDLTIHRLAEDHASPKARYKVANSFSCETIHRLLKVSPIVNRLSGTRSSRSCRKVMPVNAGSARSRNSQWLATHPRR
jgi:hypothetical protein